MPAITPSETQCMMAKFSRQKAAERPQNTGLKATAAKRPHFAHGCLRLFITSCNYGTVFNTIQLKLKVLSVIQN